MALEGEAKEAGSRLTLGEESLSISVWEDAAPLATHFMSVNTLGRDV